MKHVVLAILCVIGPVQPLCAAEPARFAVQLLGVRIGQLEMSGRAGGGAYAARARFRTTGAAGLLARGGRYAKLWNRQQMEEEAA